MKYILHFKDGHDEVVECPNRLRMEFEELLNRIIDVESWEEWYVEWQGNKVETNEKASTTHG